MMMATTVGQGLAALITQCVTLPSDGPATFKPKAKNMAMVAASQICIFTKSKASLLNIHKNGIS